VRAKRKKAQTIRSSTKKKSEWIRSLPYSGELRFAASLAWRLSARTFARSADFPAYLNDARRDRYPLLERVRARGVQLKNSEWKADVDHVRSMGSCTLSAGRSHPVSLYTRARVRFTRGPVGPARYRDIGDARYVETSETDNSVD